MASTHRRYTPTAQALHWLIALLVVVQFVLAQMAAHLPLGVRKLSLLAEHKSVGMTVLVLALIAIASVHIVAALKHHFWNKDDVLVRMLPEVRSEKES
jgi:cytochrome b561